jgi:sugar phosphate isomerase/epimerase
MYFSMDDMGDENAKTLRETSGESEKWHLIHRIASDYGFAGIQLGHQYQDTFGLSLTSVPDYIRNSFRLTYHIGGTPQLNSADDEQHWNKILSESIGIIETVGIEDVSLHPPILADVSLLPLTSEDESAGRSIGAKERLRRVLGSWLPIFQSKKVTLSLETHVTPRVFAISSIRDYLDFALSLPGLGVLIDVSHNYYDGYDIAEVLSILKPLAVTGLHLSDAIRGKELRDGTHLPIGKGHVDFESALGEFGDKGWVYGALEVRGPARNIQDSLERLNSLKTSRDEA